jgi:hypothetical protein
VESNRKKGRVLQNKAAAAKVHRSSLVLWGNLFTFRPGLEISLLEIVPENNPFTFHGKLYNIPNFAYSGE